MDTETLEQKGMTTFEGTLKRAKEGNALSQNLLGLWILHGDLPERVEVDEASSLRLVSEEKQQMPQKRNWLLTGIAKRQIKDARKR